MSEPRVSGGLECSSGHGSADEQVNPSSPLGGHATFGGLSGMLSTAGLSQPRQQPQSAWELVSGSFNREEHCSGDLRSEHKKRERDQKVAESSGPRTSGLHCGN